MSKQPKRYISNWRKARLGGAPIELHPQDIDHPHVAPRVGPDVLSEQQLDLKGQSVIVTAHGFAATPFENAFILDWLCEQGGYLGSRVMLGGHGVGSHAFRTARWQDWQAPLEAELRALHRQGCDNMIVLTTSTGGTLLLELLSRSHFPAIQKLVFVAPIIEPYEKLMRMTQYARRMGMKTSLPNTFDDEWVGSWYRELPLHAVAELDVLTRKMRAQLRKGLHLPSHQRILIVQSRHEIVVDAQSAYAVAAGLKHNHVEIAMLDSIWHLPVLPRVNDPREDAIKDWVFQRVLDFCQDQNWPPPR